MTLQEFAKQFSDYIANNGNDPSNWYAGIASYPTQRLFHEHNVNRDSDIYIYDNAATEENARSVENYLIETLGTQGGAGGGDSKTIWVYAYKITPSTTQ